MKKLLTIFAIFMAGVTTMKARDNALTETRLTDGSLFSKSQKLGLQYVLDYNPDRMLAPAYTALGKTPKAANYGGWESRQIQGHMLGHYISALAGFYYQTGSQEAKKDLEYTLTCIKNLQRDDGYFAGIPSAPFDTVFSSGGSFNVDRFSLADWWVPWYSVHKIYAGLLDAYTFAASKDALEIVTKMADWAIAGTSKMSDSEIQKMLTCEHGGMCKVFADLYGITKNEKYLKEAERWIHKEVITPAMKAQDKLQGYHANTQIPKFIGIARLYELTGKSEYRTAAEFFFDTVTKRRSYAIGGNSKGEHFGREYDESLERDTCETCNTYNMLELAEHIFAWNKKADIADFYENALYNHILASQDPETGAKTYFVAMQSGFHKIYCSHDNAMWCCTGTGLENPERYNRFIASDLDGSLYINLFIPSEITTEDGWKIKIETNFPYEEKANIKVLQKGKSGKKLKVRAPVWCKDFCEKNGLEKGDDGYTDPGQLTEGKEIEIQLPMELSIRRALDRSGNFSIKYGPLVLAADLGKKDMPRDIVDDHLIYMQSGKNLPVEVITADSKKPESWVSLTDPKTLSFTTSKNANGKGISYTLRPFFDIHHVRYATYFSSTNESENKRSSAFEKITVDFIESGRQQSEVEHRFKTEKTSIGYIDSVDRNCRLFDSEESFIQYKVKFDAAKQNKIILTVYGKDKGSLTVSYGSEILETLALKGDGGDELVDISVEVPKKLVKAKQKSAKIVREDIILKGSKGSRILEVRVVNK
ncbi:beta-L-arabinofuranosidase domain-containing protein [uncultured Treponema sp.]|uniref:beta-L-arabinofuranosidase domain-containing protein n=1 Tax=uncultured Treponema sp. TaxID=162155 RepID=UPI0025E71BCC|nr:beta-L-arabinofuranosidase domain-containing protein [uncultured Treponema sp.]